MRDIWPSAGLGHLTRTAEGWLQPTPAYWHHLLQRPELALVDESCRAERALHQALQHNPQRPVPAHELQALQDADARQNYGHFISLRDSVHIVGSLQAWYLQLFRHGRIHTPPLFIDLVAQAIVQHTMPDNADALHARAAEMLFRAQSITVEGEHVLAADSATLAEQQATQGLGELGRLLAQAQVPLKTLKLPVLDPADAAGYWAEAAQPEFRSRYLLDLTHQVTRDLGHGVQFTLDSARSGLQPLAAVLQHWVRHLLGVQVHIKPVQRIDDAQWRWHLGLDAEASALLNDLYEGLEVEPERMRRLVSLFRLDLADPAEMRRDVAGKPVYLGLMANVEQQLRLKPQNLLLNLPLAKAS